MKYLHRSSTIGSTIDYVTALLFRGFALGTEYVPI